MREDWVEIIISDVSDVFLGKTPKKVDYTNGGKYKIVKFRDVSYRGIEWGTNDKGFVYENKISDLKQLEKNDILITSSAHSSEQIGKKITYVRDLPSQFKKVFFVGELLNIRVEQKFVDFKLVYYYFLSKTAYEHIQNLVKGVHLTAGEAKKIPYFIIPLLEQKAIVAKIEQLFSELDKGIESLKTAQAKLKIYRQAVLKKAFEGELTKKWINVKNNWNFYKIGDICNCIVPNRDKPKSFSGNTKWVTTPNLNQDSIRIDYSNITLGLSDKELAIYKAKVIPKGSVIMTCVGTFGVSAIVEEEIVINQQLHAFLPSDKILNKYLAYLIKYNKNYFEKKATATTVAYLNKTNCNSMPVNLPSIHEQTQIVQEIESRLSVCDKIEETIQNSLTKAEALRQSILKKAFEGKLLDAKEIEAIKNHPEYEGAEKLLQRIKLERAK